ncbi:hypothetical protein LCGC14_2725490, partial [marine sediment metagenome]
MNAEERAKILVSRFRKGSLPYDMEQWACYAIMNAEKQTQAEVLAACNEVIGKYSTQYGALDASNNTFRTCRELAKQIAAIQPAAKDLEALLREAHK